MNPRKISEEPPHMMDALDHYVSRCDALQARVDRLEEERLELVGLLAVIWKAYRWRVGELTVGIDIRSSKAEKIEKWVKP